MIEKKLSQLGRDVQIYSLVNTVTASFKTKTIMTEMA